MKATDEEEPLDNKKVLEENKKEQVSEEKEKVIEEPNPIIEKYTRPPAFQKWNSFWKWNFQNTNNNRQRPGRAAWRGR